MSKAHWGRIIAAVAAIVIVLLVAWYLFGGNRKPAETTSRTEAPAPAAQQRAAVSRAEPTGNGAGATAEATPRVPSSSGVPSSGNASPPTPSATPAVLAAGATAPAASGGTSASPVKSSATSTAGESETALQKEAQAYVRRLTRTSKKPMQASQAEGFVKGTQVLSVSATVAQQAGSGRQIEAAGARSAQEVRQEHPPQTTVTAQSPQAKSLKAGSAGTRVAAGGAGSAQEARQEPPPANTATAESPQAGSLEPGRAVETAGANLVSAEQSRPAGSPQIASAGGSIPATTGSAPVARESTELNSSETAAAGGAPAATSAETGIKSARQVTVKLPLNEQAPITIADIIGAGADVPPDAVYYVHTVQTKDDQGIWGIVQSGVTQNFAEGVSIRHGGRFRTYRADIPHDADELRSDHSSSFLGRLIYEKSRESYVYNFRTGRVGKNPNLIKPGQEIVIVRFTPEELIDIYKHFAHRNG